MEPRPSFEQEVASNQSAESAPLDSERLENGKGRLSVRLRGGFITECSLEDPTTREQVPVLYCEPDTSTPKLTASHPMSPVGPNEGLGGQHGFPRWADYHPFHLEPGEQDASQLSLQAKRSDLGESLTRLIQLQPNKLTIASMLQSNQETLTHTSLGEHYYFSLPDGDLGGLQINGQHLDELFGEGSIEAIASGASIFWPDYNGELEASFADGKNIRLSALLEGDNTQRATDQLGLLIWKRPGSPSICLEPVAGFTKDNNGNKNDQLMIGAFGRATLTSTIELLSSKASA